MVLLLLLIILFTLTSNPYTFTDLSLIIVFSMLLFSLGLCSIQNDDTHIYNKAGEYDIAEPIYSLDTMSGLTGNFVLGTGEINSKPIYRYYTCNEAGFKVPQTIEMDKTMIKNTNECEPQVIRYYYHKELPLGLKILFYPARINPAIQFEDKDKKAILYIPENTFPQKYQVN